MGRVALPIGADWGGLDEKHALRTFVQVGGAPCDAPPAMGAPTPTPRLLVLTPDFPPAPGGIQLLTYRLAAGLKGFDTRVLAFDEAGAASFDAHSGLSTRRLRVDKKLGAAAAWRR